MLATKTKKADAQITLRYEGKIVDNGEMLIEDVVASLKGFSTVYSQIASIHNPDTKHTVTLKSINQGSFELVLNAFQDRDTQILILSSLSNISAIVSAIFTIIAIRKQTKGQPCEPKLQKTESGETNINVNITGDNNTVLAIPLGNSNGIELIKILKKLLEDSITNRAVKQIVEPLKEGEIDKVTLSYKDETETKEETIESSEKSYFDVISETKTTTKETKLRGSIRRLDKKTNNGLFTYKNQTLPMHFAMEKPERYHRFFAIKGKVEIDRHIHIDDDLTPYKIEVLDIRELEDPQQKLNF